MSTGRMICAARLHFRRDFFVAAFGVVALSILLGCAHPALLRRASGASPPSPIAADALVPSPRLIVGRVFTVEITQGLAFIELASDAPASAIVEGTELIARTLDLRETARLQASRYIRGRTLGATIVRGQPSSGDEVVWLAP